VNRAAPRATEVAERYYDSRDADAFYSKIWGGEDIHIGIYGSAGEAIAQASQRTVEQMASRLSGLDGDSTVVDLGAGYGGAARYLARTFGCRVTCVNLSEAQNARNRRLNQRAELAEQIEVVHGSFERLPLAAESYDVAWSQDAMLHSGDRRRVLAEVRRVLRPAGRFIFTDPMQADDCPEGVLEPVYARLQLTSLASPRFYREALSEFGFRELRSEDLTPHLIQHYARVRDELAARAQELGRHASREYIESVQHGLGHWIEAGRSGYLRWGIHCYQRAA
jgi:sarcosine/dimethylglycine N-methyltransferase